ncbi:uncharacterized protein [Diadema antillarum]|uniref:uncharacterized protein n=1 Tax=Diadema antillarum TaxID=105358 RepID=UPI003A884A47
MSDRKNFRVLMWCVPRSVSTAIAKCFSFIDNTQVWFEPYCLAFFQDFQMGMMGLQLPKRAEDFDSQQVFEKVAVMLKGTPMEGMFSPSMIDMSLFLRDSIRKQLDSLPADKSVFIKDMAYGISNHHDLLPSKDSGFRHTFLIRDPERMFPSWRNLLMAQLKQMPMPGQKEIKPETFDMTEDPPFMMPGYTYKCQYDLWKFVKENLDPNPVIIDIDELLSNPATMLPKYFEACGMTWDEKYLQWDASPEVTKSWRCIFPLTGSPADNMVAVTHQNAFNSSAFKPSKPKISRDEMTPDVIKAIDATSAYYNEMAAARIMP